MKTIRKLTVIAAGAVLAIIMTLGFIAPAATYAATMPTYDNLPPISVVNDTSKKDLSHVAVTVDGLVYVTESLRNSIAVMTSQGARVGLLNGISNPQGIAVNSTGTIFVTSSTAKSVVMMNRQGAKLGMLGNGLNEFARPVYVTVDPQNDEVYVADQNASSIKVYSPAGVLRRTIADAGNWPIAVAVYNNEVYVIDQPLDASGLMRTARIMVFDKNTGAAVRSFGEFGIGIGQLKMPKSISIDADGRVFIVDNFHRVVYCYDGPQGLYLGAIVDVNNNPLISATGVAVSRTGKLFVSSTTEDKIRVFGLDNYSDLRVTPDALAFTLTNGVLTPEAGTLSLANAGKSAIIYLISTATEDGSAWIQLSGLTGTMAAGSAAASETVTMNGTGLSAGIYGGTITVQDVDNAVTPPIVRYEKKIPVKLTVSNPALQVSTNALAFDSKTASSDLTVTLSGDTTGSATWMATAGSGGTGNWLSISPSSRTGNSTTITTVTVDPAGLAAGVYNGTITFMAPGVAGAPAIVNVTLTVADASAPVKTMGTHNIVVGADSQRGPSKIGIFDSSLALAKVITPFGPKYTGAIQVATGDVDGDGYDEIIAAYGANSRNIARVSVFSRDGRGLANADFVAFEATSFGARVAAGDFDGDGRAEIIVGAGPGKNNDAAVRIFSYADGAIKDTGLNVVPFSTKFGVNVAAGDIDGDGVVELIVAPGPDPAAAAVATAYKIDTATAGSWTVRQEQAIQAGPIAAGFGATVATGDLDGDGAKEIITANGGTITSFRGDGSLYGLSVTDTGAAGLEICAGDTDDDGKSEIVSGNVPANTNALVVKIYKEGQLQTSLEAFKNTASGASVALGNLGY